MYIEFSHPDYMYMYNVPTLYYIMLKHVTMYTRMDTLEHTCNYYGSQYSHMRIVMKGGHVQCMQTYSFNVVWNNQPRGRNVHLLILSVVNAGCGRVFRLPLRVAR